MSAETTLQTANARLKEARDYQSELEEARVLWQKSTVQPGLKLAESLAAFHGLVALVGVLNFQTEPFSVWKEKHCATFKALDKGSDFDRLVKSFNEAVGVSIELDGNTVDTGFNFIESIYRVLDCDTKPISDWKEMKFTSPTKIDWDADHRLLLEKISRMVQVSIQADGDTMSAAISRLNTLIVDYRTRAAHFSTHDSRVTASKRELELLDKQLHPQFDTLDNAKALFEGQKRELEIEESRLAQKEMNQQYLADKPMPNLWILGGVTDLAERKISNDLSVTREKLSSAKASLDAIYTAIKPIEAGLRRTQANLAQIDRLQPRLQEAHKDCEAGLAEATQTVTHLQHTQQAWGSFQGHMTNVATAASVIGRMSTCLDYTSMVLRAVNQGVPLQREPGVREALRGILAEVDAVLQGQDSVPNSVQDVVKRLREKLNGDTTECLTKLLESNFADTEL
ncbi:hypothetical protein BDV25DRAFT_143116 [Aspergillus avenaceus]|uniref:Uncharacterized protein n=1 Tax=Aspergillus avenaceus TaxID=36643 RepID=A0A5N6TLU5_ASPAV|nr:hypothetical protein BDV25DRAFT_143116 [Aspergillus avenaceus]